MIVFDLQCECGFCFEGWFKDHDDFENQLATGLLSCPGCGDVRGIRKILSPVIYSKGSAKAAALEISSSTGRDGEDVTRAIENTLRTLRQFVEHNFEDVGAEFAVKSLDPLRHGRAEKYQRSRHPGGRGSSAERGDRFF